MSKPFKIILVINDNEIILKFKPEAAEPFEIRYEYSYRFIQHLMKTILKMNKNSTNKIKMEADVKTMTIVLATLLKGYENYYTIFEKGDWNFEKTRFIDDEWNLDFLINGFIEEK